MKRNRAFLHNRDKEGMNHQVAVDSRATERYMLGELDEESRSAFEEHYFSCRACADDVKTAAVFVDNAKAVLSGPVGVARPVPRISSQMWMPLALAASLAIGYFVPHPAAAPLSGGLIATVAVPAGTRSAQGQGQEIVVDKQAAYFLVRLDVADDVTAPRLSWRVRTAGGQELHFQTARENQAVLPLRAADFPAGNYELILSPDTPDPKTIDRYPFAIKYH